MWFGDERRYYTTKRRSTPEGKSCGLVMKEDITQLRALDAVAEWSCGLVMKEDITQLLGVYLLWIIGCGLVMKEDITQRKQPEMRRGRVVVW